MIKKLFNSQSKTITSAAIILAVASLASQILGLLRDRILAGKFGAGDTLDIYFAAFKVPDLIYNLLVVGALTAGFIPVFTRYLQGNKKKVLESDPAENPETRPRKNKLPDEAQYLANDLLNIVGLG